MLRVQHRDDGRELAALGLVDGACVGEAELIQVSPLVAHELLIEANARRPLLLVDFLYPADVPVVDPQLVIVARLHDTV